MSKPADTTKSQYQLMAESYVLRCIGELDSSAQQQVLEACAGSPYKTADEALDDWSAAESVTVDQVEWIQKTWREKRASSPDHDPRKFAAEVVHEVFTEMEI